MAERAAAELERRYPDGVRGLRAGYVLLRRGLVCMGLPRESGESAVAWTALVPRRLRLRRRVVVLRQFADSIGYACLRRGVPVEQGGCAVRRAPGPPAPELTGALTQQQQLQQRDSLLARLPAEFATSPRYLLLPRGVKPVRTADMHRIRERRRPAPAPVLSGLPRPRRRGLRALAVVNLLGVLALAAMVHTEAPAVARQPGTGQAPGALDAGVTDVQARGAGAADAAVSIEVLGRTLASLDPGVRLGELHADGAAVRVRGRLSGSGGDNAEAVRMALAASGHFENVGTVSRRESGFVVEARYHGEGAAPASGARGPRATAPGTAGRRAARVLEGAGAERVAFERLAGVSTGGDVEERYRISAEASSDATAEAIVGLTEAETRISVEVLSLTRADDARWRMSAVVGRGAGREE